MKIGHLVETVTTTVECDEGSAFFICCNAAIVFAPATGAEVSLKLRLMHLSDRCWPFRW